MHRQLLMLPSHDVDVWLASIELPQVTLAALARHLSADERERAARFRFEEDQRRSIVGRALLRILLGRYLDRRAAELRFVAGEQGKPALADGAIEFNVSHSGSCVALAFAHGTPIGVDVEVEREKRDLIAIAERFFAPQEAELVRNAPGGDAAAIFYATWTAKESVIKGVGGGLSIDLASFLVAPSRNERTPVRNAGGNPRLDGWSIQALAAPAGYQAAVAAQGDGWKPVVRSLDPASLLI